MPPGPLLFPTTPPRKHFLHCLSSTYSLSVPSLFCPCQVEPRTVAQQQETPSLPGHLMGILAWDASDQSTKIKESQSSVLWYLAGPLKGYSVTSLPPHMISNRVASPGKAVKQAEVLWPQWPTRMDSLPSGLTQILLLISQPVPDPLHGLFNGEIGTPFIIYP